MVLIRSLPSASSHKIYGHRHCCSSNRLFKQLGSFAPCTLFSSTSTPDDDDPPPSQPHPDNSATIIQGPSLLASTGVHRPSPSLFHLPGLRSLPFWTAPDHQQQQKGRGRIAYNDPIVTAAIQHVESNYIAIRSEYFSAVLGQGTETTNSILMNSGGTISKPLEPDYDVATRGGEHADDALHSGSWDWHSYILNGVRNERFREKCPKTAQVVDDLDKERMLFRTPFAFCFFSTLHGQSSIKAHSGPMNLRLRMHLPLIVPTKNPQDDSRMMRPSSSSSSDGSSSSRRLTTGIQVADQVREWHEGSAIVLDDSYVHEVWNNTDRSRVLFLLDLWHPDVRMEEREKIANMFDYARGKGWIGGANKTRW